MFLNTVKTYSSVTYALMKSMLKSLLKIINFFNKINNHKITNGSMERVNRDIKNLSSISFGSTSFSRVRNEIMCSINEDAPILLWRYHINFEHTSLFKATHKFVGTHRLFYS